MDFQFAEKREALDWGQVRTADLRLGDLNLLQPLLNHLSCVSLDRADLTTLRDAKAVKAFQLAQLGIEALYASQRQLCTEAQRLSIAQKQLRSQTHFLQEEVQHQAQTLTRLEGEVARKTKLIEGQHLAAQQGVTASSLRSVMQLANALPCPHCSKRFLSTHFLEAHVQRRHPPQPSPEVLFQTQLQQFRDFFTAQLKEATEKSARELALIQANYEEKQLPPRPPAPSIAPSLPTAAVEEFLAAQQQLRTQLASRPLPQSLPTSIPAVEDSEWLQRLEASLEQLVSDSVEKWKAAHPPEPQVPEEVKAVEEPPPLIVVPVRFYPESTVLSHAGDVEEDEASPRLLPQLHSQAGFIEEDECEEPEEAIIQLEEENVAPTYARTGQMSSLSLVPATRRLTPEEVERAAADLGIDLDFEPQNAFLARAMLLSTTTDWQIELRGSTTFYQNSKTGNLSNSHPSLEVFQKRLELLRGRKWKHEGRDFLQALQPHLLTTSRESQTSLLEHTPEEFARTRELLRTQLFSTPPKSKPKPRARLQGPAAAVVQGFMENLSVEQLLDSTEAVELSLEPTEGLVLAKGMIAHNDLGVVTTAEREARHLLVSAHAIRRILG